MQLCARWQSLNTQRDARMNWRHLESLQETFSACVWQLCNWRRKQFINFLFRDETQFLHRKWAFGYMAAEPETAEEMRIWKRYETITQPTYLTWKPTDASSAGCSSQITHKTLCLRQISTRNVWHWYLYEHVRGKEIRDCIFFSTLRFYLEISARYISLSVLWIMRGKKV